MTSRFPTRRLLSCTAALTMSASAFGLATPPTPAHADGALSVLSPGGAAPTLTQRQLDALALIETHVFGMLPVEQQAAVVGAGAYTPPADAPYMHLPRLGEEGYHTVRRIVSRDAWNRLMPAHQHALVAMMEAHADARPVPAMCFSPDTPDEVRLAFERAQNGPFGTRFQQGNRWPSTASGSTGARGSRITLRYSFVPDGTMVPDLGGTLRASNLFATMNGVYGTPAVWQALYAQVLTRWTALIGVTYLFEPNDDGVAIDPNNFTASSGIVGVRGDCRFSGTALDGPSNVLAFNYFPQIGVGGDMVLDTSDTFFTGAGSTASNSIRLRNVLAHEHGHGLGFAHVCPINRTKLMEPFYSGNYDGPQLDDVLNGQRYYGDALEPNNTAATADTLTAATTTDLSLDGSADQDWFAFTLAAGSSLTVTVAPPAGTSYLDGVQNGDGTCTAGVSFNPLTVNPLAVEIRGGTGGASVLVTGVAAAAGAPATATYLAPTAGTVYARVYTPTLPTTVDNIQAYTITTSTAVVTTPVVSVSLPQAPPTLLSPSDPTTFNVQVQVTNDTLASAKLFYRYSGAAFTGVDLSPTATAGLYTATLPPAPCGSTPEFYVSAAGRLAAAVTVPAGAPTAARYTATTGTLTTVFQDDFSAPAGWTFGATGDTATTGKWTSGDPLGTTANSGTASGQAQPEQGTSAPACAFTGQGTTSTNAGEADVDGGFTTLVSPRLNLAGAVSPVITYQRWYSNHLGQNPSTNTFRVDVSANDGQTWVNAETVGPGTAQAQGGWYTGTINVAALVTPSANVRVRFVADDATGALVEAGVDDFKVSAVACATQPPPCPADYSGSSGVDLGDIFMFLNDWFAANPHADFNAQNGVDLADIFAFLNAWFAGCP